MKKLSVIEFKDFCDELRPDEYIYATENQKWIDRYSTYKEMVSYKTISVSLDYKSICFKHGNQDFLCFNRVKYIILHKSKFVVDTFFTIVCGDRLTDERNTLYTMIAKKF